MWKLQNAFLISVNDLIRVNYLISFAFLHALETSEMKENVGFWTNFLIVG